MLYPAYKKKMLWKRVDYDSAYWFQCVDLFKDFARQVLGIAYWRTGNAKEIRTNKYKVFGKGWKQIKWTKDLKEGDIIVRWVGTYWHIAIVDTNTDYVLEQNWSGKNSGNGLGPNAIRLQKYSKAFWSWVRRKI